MAKYFISTSYHPLHQRKLHTKDPITVTPVILSWIQNIKILFIEIDNGCLGLGLPPNVNAHKVLREMLEMHHQTNYYNDAYQYIFIGLLDQDIHEGNWFVLIFSSVICSVFCFCCGKRGP